MKRGLAAMVLGLLLAGCAQPRHGMGPDLAQAAGWRWEILPAGAFDLAVATSPRGDGDVLTVYLEGDGFAYVNARQPALDPTPTDPVSLKLALAEPGKGAVAWIGRPCQYTLPDHGRNCRTVIWTTGRTAPEVIDSMGMAVDALKRRSGSGRVILVGYSGGGAIAVLLAARRTDVAQIITVAANLDLEYWTRRDGLSPLAGSLDPARQPAETLERIPQLHFTGGQDRIVGTDVVRSYLNRLSPQSPARLVEIPNFTHSCCWAKDWRLLLSQHRTEISGHAPAR